MGERAARLLLAWLHQPPCCMWFFPISFSRLDVPSSRASCRCNMVLGFVVPRQQMAFSQPTEAGVRLVAVYTGLRRFLVYGV